MQSSKHYSYWPFLVALGVFASLMGWQYSSLLKITGGIFSYALDDAYIHLALSENIMKGHYGVNLNEYSAPSSSILWSYLLAPLAHWQYWPLWLNIACSLGALVIWDRACNQWVGNHDTSRALLNICFIFLANLVGITFTGMENVLQLLVSMGICVGVFYLIDQGKLSRWLILCIILAPLVRYETLALSGMALVVVAAFGRWRQAMIIGLATLLPLIYFSVYLNSLGLGVLPSSISAKSSAMQSSALASTALNFYKNLYEPTGSILSILLLPLAIAGFNQWRDNKLFTVFCIMMCAAVMAHLALGRIGNWGRYEIYIWISLFMSLLYAFQEPLRRWLDSPSFHPVLACACLIFFSAITAKRYIVTTTMSATGSANIALQQYQMHRFVTEFWQKDVAVNDLGWVAYQNDHYVLDVWGLANQQALKYRKSGTQDFLHRLSQDHNIELAIIYEEWFSDIPEHWIRVGQLHFPDDLRRMTSAQRAVTFFATSPDAAKTVLAKLKDFNSTLPSGVDLSLQLF